MPKQPRKSLPEACYHQALCYNNKVTDHHAIIPTEQFEPVVLNSEERNVYDPSLNAFCCSKPGL